MAVTGLADPAALLRIDAGRPGLPLSLTKPIGSGVLNARHKATGEVFPAAIEVMTTLNRAASKAALAAGLTCATDVTGFGLLGHLYKLARASGVTAVLDSAAVPLIDGALAALQAGYIPGGSRRNLDWVAPHVRLRAADVRAAAAAGRRADLRRAAGGGRDPRCADHRRAHPVRGPGADPALARC